VYKIGEKQYIDEEKDLAERVREANLTHCPLKWRGFSTKKSRVSTYRFFFQLLKCKLLRMLPDMHVNNARK